MSLWDRFRGQKKPGGGASPHTPARPAASERHRSPDTDSPTNVKPRVSGFQRELHRISNGLARIASRDRNPFFLESLRPLVGMIDRLACALESDIQADRVTGLPLEPFARAVSELLSSPAFERDLLLHVGPHEETDDLLTLLADFRLLVDNLKLETSPSALPARLRYVVAQPSLPRRRKGLQPRPKSTRLPVIDRSSLPISFAHRTPEDAEGQGLIAQTAEQTNPAELAAAETELRQAIAAGLPPAVESFANCQLGILALERGDLVRGVDYLLRCLSGERVLADAAWQAAERLSVIYAQAGREEEASAIHDVAQEAGEIGHEFAPEAREKLRRLVADKCGAGPPAGAQPGGGSEGVRRDLAEKLQQLADSVEGLARRADYDLTDSDRRSLQPRLGIRRTLAGVAVTLHAAASALVAHLGMDGSPVSDDDVAIGLRRMSDDLDQILGPRVNVGHSLAHEDAQLLRRILSEVNSIAASMEDWPQS